MCTRFDVAGEFTAFARSPNLNAGLQIQLKAEIIKTQIQLRNRINLTQIHLMIKLAEI